MDTNILARYYIQDRADTEASKQHQAARGLIEAGDPLMVCKTVLLEFEWVMRGYYGFEREEILPVFRHLLSLAHIRIEDRSEVEQAVDNYAIGFDLADALHHASYGSCAKMASFDDRKFAKRAQRNGLTPPVFIPR
ncbi:MAG: type II toxin-antitoxin system VapC family toxin [Gammaproteobacteria bacterium]|nr:type II toxin-antitoxin system VapC family toxin [Gammaproteobacteria bacterium]